jgi:YHS domain-containing protein
MSVEMTFVSCDVCGMEIPKSGATAPEAVDYFVYFCGPECYEKWTSHRTHLTRRVHEDQNAEAKRSEQA